MGAKEITKQTLFFILKVLLVVALILIAFVVGTMVGYSVLGGGNPKGVFDTKLWTHIFDYFIIR